MSLLDDCLGISGSFENNSPNYQAVTGNFDKQGISVGVLQWCAGMGSLGTLLGHMLYSGMTPEQMDAHFSGIQVSSIPSMHPSQAVQFCKDNFLSPEGHVTAQGLSQWVSLLSTPEAVSTQVALATNTVLAKALSLASLFCPDNSSSPRAIAFFFDLVTQSGGMSNSRGHVDPIPLGSDASEALAYANSHSTFSRLVHNALASDPNAPLANQLLIYAYKRAQLSKPEYMWDAFARRATIAARSGVVHGVVFDLSKVLP